MTEYEVTYILRPSLEEADVDTRVTTFNEVITSRGGELTHGEKLGKKRLAYEIADVREGYYVVMGFRSDAAASKELERQLKLQEDVLRALLVQLDKKALAAMAAPPVQLAPVESDY